MTAIILKPSNTAPVYEEGACIFQNFYEKVTDVRLQISEIDDGVSDLVVIGSDSVNDFLMQEVLELRISKLGIRYGTDDYCIYTYKHGERRVLVLAGGRGRSTLYAIYDYFERYANCHYFWDGDVIHHAKTLPMEGIRVLEQPRFFYRGLRYFAHRGLKRFQAEHWSFEDWKQEIDWMVKKRLNFFMLRIGMDDIWQRAFPEDVPYPEDFRKIEGADASSYNDRSDFWTLKYRGELKIQVLEYARKLDLMYPTDCGTMTHWYSRTPVEFLDSRKPAFLKQASSNYIGSDTGKVFDFTQKENMDYYMHLTETMVKEYEKSTALFHTIGLGERKVYADLQKNLAMKLLAYRRIAENIRQKYPESKLMLASWDFCGFWKTSDVAELIRELDPERTIILDYTSDMNDPDHSFLNWDVVGKFPWIFGMFHAYEAESELRGPYHRTDERLKIAAEDPYCKGMILWPELAHSDPLVLEYLSANSWAPLRKSIEKITEDFCNNRYGKYAECMNYAWQSILPFIKLGEWGGEGHARPYENKGVALCTSWFMHMDLWTRLCMFLSDGAGGSKREELREYFLYKEAKSKALTNNITSALQTLSCNIDGLKEPFILRDSIDIVRTVLGRFLNYILINALDTIEDKERLCTLQLQYMELLDIMSEVLSLNTDFSVYHTLKELENTAPTNPDFEITLKRNICNAYCTQPAFELTNHIFKREAKVVFERLIHCGGEVDWDFKKEYQLILDDFMQTPLADMKPSEALQPEKVLMRAAEYMKYLLQNGQ